MIELFPHASKRSLCRLLGLNRSTVWRHQNDRTAAIGDEAVTRASVLDEVLVQASHRLIEEHPSWGYRRIWAWLRHREGLQVNRKKVYRTCKLRGWLCSQREKTPRPRVQQRVSQCERSNERWAIDATSFACGRDGIGHLIAVIDCHDRQILGVEVALRGRAVEAERALEDACLRRFGLVYPAPEQERPVLRSDNGKVFCSRRFRYCCSQYGLQQEYITPYTPQQNGLIERFFRSLKEECLWLHNFANFEEARAAILKWIRFYNEERPHQALDYQSPAEVWEKQEKLVA